jgi:hypothetical protein
VSPCGLDYPRRYELDEHIWRYDGIATCLYNAHKCITVGMAYKCITVGMAHKCITVGMIVKAEGPSGRAKIYSDDPKHALSLAQYLRTIGYNAWIEDTNGNRRKQYP